MPNVEAFRSRFNFNPKRSLWVGVERECFITNGEGKLVPKAADVLSTWWLHEGASHGPWAEEEIPPSDPKRLIGYELSACQLEVRAGPCKLARLPQHLKRIDTVLREVLSWHGLSASHQEVGPEDMPLDVYPDPTGRYQAVTAKMSPDQLLAACRIIGTHVHIGMPDHETAIHVYNCVRRNTDDLCRLGDRSNGQRLAIYQAVTPNVQPPEYHSWEHFYECACDKNFHKDPRCCWTLIRISVHGTIEFRMFGTSESVSEIGSWARECHRLCENAMAEQLVVS